MFNLYITIRKSLDQNISTVFAFIGKRHTVDVFIAYLISLTTFLTNSKLIHFGKVWNDKSARPLGIIFENKNTAAPVCFIDLILPSALTPLFAMYFGWQAIKLFYNAIC